VLSLEYAERKNEFSLIFDFSGPRCNPLENEGEDSLSLMIVKRIAKDSCYLYEGGVNQIKITI
jgi:hypothetical protein